MRNPGNATFIGKELFDDKKKESRKGRQIIIQSNITNQDSEYRKYAKKRKYPNETKNQTTTEKANEEQQADAIAPPKGKRRKLNKMKAATEDEDEGEAEGDEGKDENSDEYV